MTSRENGSFRTVGPMASGLEEFGVEPRCLHRGSCRAKVTLLSAPDPERQGIGCFEKKVDNVVRKRSSLTSFHPTPPGSSSLLQVSINSEEVQSSKIRSSFPMVRSSSRCGGCRRRIEVASALAMACDQMEEARRIPAVRTAGR
jgi:hypothetical protein